MVKDLATLRVLADPFRYRILRLLEVPRSVRELADELGRPPDRLYYHLRQLEGAGLVRPTGDRRWQALDVALRVEAVDVPPALATGMLGVALEGVAAAYADSVGLGPAPDGVKRTFLSHVVLRLTEAQRIELAERLAALTAEFVGLARANEELDVGSPYGLVTGVYRGDPAQEAAT